MRRSIIISIALALTGGGFYVYKYAHVNFCTTYGYAGEGFVCMRPLPFGTPSDLNNNNTLHEWACEVVFKSAPKDLSGCYDICFALAGGTYDSKAGTYHMPRSNIDPDKFKQNLVNACAIVLEGAEW